ncbi:hypothetical protein Pint_05868 [Pistacia integerrima]|uniref:Uncharacterized protein n=1 Tax=Pistacia integerrima TaxID=434235 RepID=A0ACC0Z8J3_9ROSI|nr:hypothetical protein Pint_05868 [Pistacia integerrima]
MACSSTDDISLLENDHYPPKVTTTGKSFDPRLLVLLEYFRELHERKGELFRKIFPGIHNEFVEFFKKIDELLSQVKCHNQMRGVRTMQRSLSVGSPRTRAIDGDKSPLRLDRFKIRTVVLDGGGQGSGLDGGQPSVPSQVLQNRNLSIFPSQLGCLRHQIFLWRVLLLVNISDSYNVTYSVNTRM